MGEPVRVALIGCSGLLGEIIGQAVAAQPDVDVVADLAEPTDGASLADVGADIVLWNNADESAIAAWLSELSSHEPRVLATLGDGRDAALWELTPHRTELGPLSPAALVQIILGGERT